MRTSIKRRGGICIVVEGESQNVSYTKETKSKKASVKIQCPALQCKCTNKYKTTRNSNTFLVKKYRIRKFWNKKSTCELCTHENLNTDQSNLIGEWLLDC